MFYYVRKFSSEAEKDLHTFRLSYENQSCKIGPQGKANLKATVII